MATEAIEFMTGNATADVVQKVWLEVLAEVKAPDSEARAEVEALGGDPDAAGPISVEVSEISNDFGATFLATVVAPFALHVLKALFDDLVRPRLVKRFGVDVGEVIER